MHLAENKLSIIARCTNNLGFEYLNGSESIFESGLDHKSGDQVGWFVTTNASKKNMQVFCTFNLRVKNKILKFIRRNRNSDPGNLLYEINTLVNIAGPPEKN